MTLAGLAEDPVKLLSADEAELKELFERELKDAGARGKELHRLTTIGLEIVAIIRRLYEAVACADPLEFDLSPSRQVAVARLQELWNEGEVSPLVRSVPEVRGSERDTAVEVPPQAIIETVWYERLVAQRGPLGQSFGDILKELLKKIGWVWRCEYCGNIFIRSAGHQRFCSESHRQLAYQRRKKQK